jgi:cell division protein FtsB
VNGADGRAVTAVLALAILAVTGSALLGEHGIAHLLRLRAERQALGQSAFALLQTNDGLRSQIARLRSDDLYLEELARKQLGLVRPNETVYRVRRPRA